MRELLSERLKLKAFGIEDASPKLHSLNNKKMFILSLPAGECKSVWEACSMPSEVNKAIILAKFVQEKSYTEFNCTATL